MKEWRAGDLMCVSAGVAVLSAAGMPWVQVADPPAALGAVVLGMYEPLVLVGAIGVVLIVSGLMRTLWSALVALASSFAIAIAIIMISEGAAGALQAYAPGVVGHGNGLGVSTLLAAGLLSGLGGVVIAIQREPGVVTRAPDMPA